MLFPQAFKQFPEPFILLFLVHKEQCSRRWVLYLILQNCFSSESVLEVDQEWTLRCREPRHHVNLIRIKLVVCSFFQNVMIIFRPHVLICSCFTSLLHIWSNNNARLVISTLLETTKLFIIGYFMPYATLTHNIHNWNDKQTHALSLLTDCKQCN